MQPENVHTKTLPSRRTRYFIVGLVVIILVLSYNLFKLHGQKKELVRRKAYFILKYRGSKEMEGKLSQALTEKTSVLKKMEAQLGTSEKAREESNNKIRQLNQANEDFREQLGKLEESAAKSKQDLEGMKNQYQGAETQLNTVKENLQKALISCQHTKDQTSGYEQALKKKEAELEQCLQNQQNTAKQNQDLVDEKRRLQDTLRDRPQNTAPRVDSNTAPRVDSNTAPRVDSSKTAAYPKLTTSEREQGSNSATEANEKRAVFPKVTNVGNQSATTATPSVTATQEAGQKQRIGNTPSLVSNTTSRATKDEIVATKSVSKPEESTTVERNVERVAPKDALRDNNEEDNDEV